jgi:hypothetical protein
MAQFPVKYAQTPPPAAGPVVRAHLDVDTGAEWAGRGLMRAGEALTEFGQKLQKAEDVMAVSTLERKSAEIRNAAFQAMQETQDTDAQLKIWEKARTEIGGLPSGQRKRVADHFTVRLNEMMPVADAHAADVMRRTKIKRLEDDLKLNDAADYENSAAANFAKRQYMAEKVGLQTPELTKWKIENFDTHSKLLRVRKQIDSQDPAHVDAAIAALGWMDTGGLSAKQLEDWSQSLDLARRVRDAQGRRAEGEIDDLEAKLHGADLPPVDFQTQANAIRQKILTDSRLNGTQREVQLRQHLAWTERRAAETLRQTKAQELGVERGVAEKILAVDKLPVEHQAAAYTALEADVEANASALGVSPETRLTLRDEIRRHGRGEARAAATQVKNAVSSIILDAYRTRPSGPILEAIMREANQRIDASEALSATEKAAEHKRVLALPATVGAGKDYDAVAALRAEVIEVEKTGFGGPELKSRIIAAKLNDVFGLGKGANAEAQGLLERLERREFSDLRQATVEVREELHGAVKDTETGPEALALFDLMIDAWIKKHPQGTVLEALQYAKVQSAMLKKAEPAKEAGWLWGEKKEGDLQRMIRTWPAALGPGQAAPTAETIPPRENREVGKTYTFPNGRRFTWRGTGWEAL